MLPMSRMVRSVTSGRRCLRIRIDRSVRDLHDRGEPCSAAEVQVEHGIGAGERPLAPSPLGCEEGDELDQLLVGVGHGRADLPTPVSEHQQHPVVPGDLDVLDVGQVHEWLQPAQTEEAVEDGCCQGLLVVQAHQPTAVERVGPGVVLEEAPDDRPAELAAVLLVDRLSRPQVLGQLLRCPLAEGPDKSPVDSAPVVADPTEGDGVRGGGTRRSPPSDGSRHGRGQGGERRRPARRTPHRRPSAGRVQVRRARVREPPGGRPEQTTVACRGVFRAGRTAGSEERQVGEQGGHVRRLARCGCGLPGVLRRITQVTHRRPRRQTSRTLVPGELAGRGPGR